MLVCLLSYLSALSTTRHGHNSRGHGMSAYVADFYHMKLSFLMGAA
jgi:hypothetical protein